LSILDQVKRLKGIDDELQDKLLEEIINLVTSGVMGYINSKRSERLEELPDDLDYIVVEVATKRFNRLNSEGLTSKSEEGSSLSFEEDYLSEYYGVLNEYTDIPSGRSTIKMW